jgi:hypothetical protein
LPTFTDSVVNGQIAPIADLRALAPEPKRSNRTRHSRRIRVSPLAFINDTCRLNLSPNQKLSRKVRISHG